jgi:hypothetical protein
MTRQIVKIHNAATGEIVEREMNAEELAQREADRAAAEAAAAEAAAKEAARQSALDKLAALGLTPEEIAALS